MVVFIIRRKILIQLFCPLISSPKWVGRTPFIHQYYHHYLIIYLIQASSHPSCACYNMHTMLEVHFIQASIFHYIWKRKGLLLLFSKDDGQNLFTVWTEIARKAHRHQVTPEAIETYALKTTITKRLTRSWSAWQQRHHSSVLMHS